MKKNNLILKSSLKNNFPNCLRTFIASLLLIAGAGLTAQTAPDDNAGTKFFFKYRQNDSYRILSKVDENVYVNNNFNHQAEIVNRITVNVTDVDQNAGSARHEAVFMTTENSVGIGNGAFTYGEEYHTVFKRDRQGHYDISDEYFMPVVRDVPGSPDREISVGEIWTEEGHEAHDLRRTFGMKKPYKVPFDAVYRYCGPVKDADGKTFYKFEVNYNMYFAIDTSHLKLGGEVPEETSGYSHQTIYWDDEKGYIDHYNEDFRITIKTTEGNYFRFEGQASAKVTEFKRSATEENVNSVMEKITDLGIENVSVSAGEKGLTLSIENIQFEPDSNILRNSEKLKLDKIITILKDFEDNDLLITGHTALRGSEYSRQKLSEERAEAVAEYLINKKVKDKYHIFTQGLGATKPVADNNSLEGLAKNRRVEITIMDR